MRGSTLEADQLGLNPSSAAYQLDLESYSSSLIFTFLICKMGIDIARHPRYLCEFKGTHDARRCSLNPVPSSSSTHIRAAGVSQPPSVWWVW